MRHRSHTSVGLVAAVAMAIVLGACGGGQSGTQSAASTTVADNDGLVAQVASYELVAGQDQRVIVGVFSNDKGMLSFGSADLSFAFLGSGDSPSDPRPGMDTQAGFLPIPGSATPTDGESTPARFTSPSEARGVYGADSVTFDEPGFWEVTVAVDIAGERREATAAFEVGDEIHVPVAGDPAPRTQNLLPGDVDAPPTAIDSRADDSGEVPDPELHEETVAEALAADRPVMVVVSTPVFCVSQFCGPITDTVQELARENSAEMDFVHIEVWRDFENNAINRAAAEWIWPDRAGDPAEPWVFLVDRTGAIVQRWDNVATEQGLAEAVEFVLRDA